MPGHIDEYETLLTAKPHLDRPHQGRRLSLTPRTPSLWALPARCLRASGVAYDIRKVFPYSSYDEFDFNVQTQTAGDCYARYQVRVAEMRESIKIVKQAMEKISLGRPFPRRSSRHHSALARGDEDLHRRPHLPFQDFHRRFCAAAGRGLSGHRVAARRNGRIHGQRRLAKPYRVHFRTPSFVNLQTLRKLCEGRLIADVVACIGTTDIVLGEVDR